ncbi:MAG: hypothetical protein PHR77_16330 [Kiritimatiellae bacterium]|nr:hypothetical protein [Kiritimatiellia bacterium]MDD5522190.1 hypothetical protein [Kiritimatiellia bacterium]
MINFLKIKYVRIVVMLISICVTENIFPSGVDGHNDAARLGATLAPEPFKSNPDFCWAGTYPDDIADWCVGHDSDGYLRKLLTFEAINALRAQDVPKALFLASVATHYLVDRACIPHSGWAWHYSKGWQQFLPVKYRDVKLPFIKEGNEYILQVLPPEYCSEAWTRAKGSSESYLEFLPSIRPLVKPEMLRKFDQWTFTDAFLYGRWYSGFIALDLLDGENIKHPPFRFKDTRGMQAVLADELINTAAVCGSYYGYLVTAAGSDVPDEWSCVLPPRDRFLELVRNGTIVVIGEKAPWPVERAALVLAMELVRAEQRFAVIDGRKLLVTSPESLIVRYNSARPDQRLAQSNLIVLSTPEDIDLQKSFNINKVVSGKRGRITVRKAVPSRGRNTIILMGATMQDSLYLVDYLLDVSWDPFHGRWPADKIVNALQKTWAGWKLIEDLRSRSGIEAVEYAKKYPRNHKSTRVADAELYKELLGSDLKRGASDLEWSRFFLLEVRLADGRQVPDVIAGGCGK